MNLGISFAPLVPDLRGVGGVRRRRADLDRCCCVARSRGALLRAVALALLVLALANPSFTREDREPIPSVAAVIVDKSPSQNFGDRNAQTEGRAGRARRAAQAHSRPRSARGRSRRSATAKPTARGCFRRLSSTLADVPPDRVAGAILITDGRVHDVPADAAALGFAAPLHALITGHPNEIDRRVVLTQTPRFGIVGQSQTIGFRIEDQGASAGLGASHDPPRRRSAWNQRTVARRHRRQGQRADPACRRRTSSRSRPRRSRAN